MSNNYFKFKQFTVYQDKTAMKVGVDSVLLGSWTECNDAQNILDIGTGTGLLALMLAQKSDAKITAIELENEAYEQACENVRNSKWNNISIVHSSVQAYAEQTNSTFDLIICNPPYFHKSFAANDYQRNIARHDNNLTISVLVQCVSQLLSDKGSFYVIFPYDRKDELLSKAAERNLQAVKILAVRGNENKNPNRILVRFEFGKPISASNYNKLCEEDVLSIRNSTLNQYSSKYRELTKDYYLNALFY